MSKIISRKSLEIPKNNISLLVSKLIGLEVNFFSRCIKLGIESQVKIISAIYVLVILGPYIKLMITQLVAMVQNQLRCVKGAAFFLFKELCN